MTIFSDLRFILRVSFLYLFVMLLFRALFWAVFKPLNVHFDSTLQMLGHWWLGFRYDFILIAAFISLFLVVFFLIRPLFFLIYRPERIVAPLQALFLALGLTFIILGMGLDFYAYLDESTRLSVTLLKDFWPTYDPQISQMAVLGTGSFMKYAWVPLVLFLGCYFLFRYVFLASSRQVMLLPQRSYRFGDGVLGLILFSGLMTFLYLNKDLVSESQQLSYLTASSFLKAVDFNPVVMFLAELL